MNARICPSCEEPVAENDRICDVCNTPLRHGSATGILPGAMSPIILPFKVPDPPTSGVEESQERATLADEVSPDSSHNEEAPEQANSIGAVEPAQAAEVIPKPLLESSSTLANQDPDTNAPLEDETTRTDLPQTEVDPDAKPEVEVEKDTSDEGTTDKDLAEVSEPTQATALEIPAPPETMEDSQQENIQEAETVEVVEQEPMPTSSFAGAPSPGLDFKPVESPHFEIPPPPQNDSSSVGNQGQNAPFGEKQATPQDVAFQIKEETLATCKRLAGYGYHLYGLFGRPSAGKSSMIYALRQHFLKGDQGFGGYTPEGPEWDDLAGDLEDQWRHNRPIPTKDKLHPYRATSTRGHKHISLLDIAGERFERVQNWTQEIFDFFDLYFDHCKGMFFLVELDDLVGSSRVDYGASMRIQAQMSRIVSFLAVAGNRERWRGSASLAQKQRKLEKALKAKNVKLHIPVALCLTKADRVGSMNFGPALGRIIPGSPAPESDPWNVLQAVWPEHVQSLLDMVPYLKVDWLSCLGTTFEEDRQFTQSVGLRSVFQHVVLDPPKPWTLSTKQYLKFQNWLRL